MRIKVYRPVAERDGVPPQLDLDDTIGHYRVRLFIGDDVYEVSSDEPGKLALRQVDGKQINVQPRASNEVHVTSEPWK